MVITLPYLVAAILMPILGKIADNYGQRMTMIYISGVINVSLHILQLMFPDCLPEDKCWYPVIPYIGYGINMTIYMVVMWGSLSYIVEDERMGAAYGVLVCIQNIGCTFMPPLLGYIHDLTEDNEYGYYWVEMSFVIMAAISLMLKFWLHQWDRI